MALYPESDSVNGYSVIITGDLTLTPSNQGNFNEKLIVCQNTVNTTITLGMDIRNNFKTMIRASATGTVTVVPVAGVMVNGSSTPFVMPAGLGNLLEIVYGVRNSLTVTQIGGSSGAASALTAPTVDVIQRQFTPVMAAVASRTYQPNIKDASKKGYQNRTWHQLKDNVEAIVVRYPNYYVVPLPSGIETSAGGPATLKLGLERIVNGVSTFTQATFSGAASGTIPAGGYLDSDPIPFVGGKAGEAFYLRPNFLASTGQIVATSVPSWGAAIGATFGEGSNAGAGAQADLTMGGTLTTASGGTQYYPSGIFGLTAKPAILVVGSSRESGVGDTPDLIGGGCVGQAERSLGLKYAVINAAVGSDRLANFAANSVNRRALGAMVNRIIIDHPSNDIRDGVTAAAAFTIIQNIVTLMKANFPGVPIYTETMGPITSSTDNWATDANQTIDGSNARRVAYNNLLRTTRMPGLDGVIEVADILETYRDSGKWRTNGVEFFYTFDGLHESQNGYIALAQSGVFSRSIPGL